MKSPWSRFKSWTRSVLGRKRLEADMESEISYHLEARAADLARAGLNPRDAMRQARLEFGTVAAHKDAIRSSLGLRWWDELWEDLRYGVRILRKSPGFTSIAVASLALAIGANTTIFSVANEMLFEHLGVPHPEQLRLLTMSGDSKVMIHMIWGDSPEELPDPKHQNQMVRFKIFTYPIYQQIRANNQVLEDLFAFKSLGRVNITVDSVAEAANAQLVSGNFYQQMQVKPVLGRMILPSDDGAPGTGTVAVISEGFWSRAFGRSPAVLGKVINVDMTPVTIVGVNPSSFTGAESVQQSPDLFMPLSTMPLFRAPFGESGPVLASTEFYWLQVMARAKPGVSGEQARASLDVALGAAVRATTTIKKGETLPHILIDDGSRGLNFAAGQYARPLYVLLAMVAAVLLMACANMASLMLARASARQREMSVRLALGAGRLRVLRQVLTESLLLSFMGGIFGLVLGYLCRRALPRLVANGWDYSDINVPFNWKVFAFTATITIGTGIVFGILPAWAATRAEIGAALKQGARTATRRRHAWSGKVIVAFQIAVSTVLVIAAWLFLRTLVNLNRIDPGFAVDHLVLFEIDAPSLRYPAPKDVALHARLEEALRAVPGVEGVTTSDAPLLVGMQMITGFHVEGTPEVELSPGENPAVMSNLPRAADVGTDFISVMKIPMVAGRAFNSHDTETSPKVAIINQALADVFFPHQNPLGKRFSAGPNEKDGKWIEIVGVCANTRYDSLRTNPAPLHFGLYRQQPEMGGLTYIVRTPMKAEAIVPSLRAAVQRIDRDLPLLDIRTQRQQIDTDLQQERTFASLSAGFGLLALMLACVGIYGIMAYTVAQRINEIGIRLALGARRGQVRSMVLRESCWLALAGVAAGISVALALGRLVESLLYGVEAADALSVIGAGVVLLAVALSSGWIPARRASLLEPMNALRHE
jgi:predicted permease